MKARWFGQCIWLDTAFPSCSFTWQITSLLSWYTDICTHLFNQRFLMGIIPKVALRAICNLWSSHWWSMNLLSHWASIYYTSCRKDFCQLLPNHRFLGFPRFPNQLKGKSPSQIHNCATASQFSWYGFLEFLLFFFKDWKKDGNKSVHISSHYLVLEHQKANRRMWVHCIVQKYRAVRKLAKCITKVLNSRQILTAQMQNWAICIFYMSFLMYFLGVVKHYSCH